MLISLKNCDARGGRIQPLWVNPDNIDYVQIHQINPPIAELTMASGNKLYCVGKPTEILASLLPLMQSLPQASQGPEAAQSPDPDFGQNAPSLGQTVGKLISKIHNPKRKPGED